MIRASRPLTTVALVAALLAGGCALTGCSVVRNAVDGASGGTVDVGGPGVPKDYPASDVPLIDGDVIYGAGVDGDGGRVWNVTVSVTSRSAAQAITTQLTEAGFTAAMAAGSDATGDTASFTKAPYTVLIAVSKPDEKTGWLANYTVTKSDPAPSPTATSAG